MERNKKNTNKVRYEQRKTFPLYDRNCGIVSLSLVVVVKVVAAEKENILFIFSFIMVFVCNNWDFFS